MVVVQKMLKIGFVMQEGVGLKIDRGMWETPICANSEFVLWRFLAPVMKIMKIASIIMKEEREEYQYNLLINQD